MKKIVRKSLATFLAVVMTLSTLVFFAPVTASAVDTLVGGFDGLGAPDSGFKMDAVIYTHGTNPQAFVASPTTSQLNELKGALADYAFNGTQIADGTVDKGADSSWHSFTGEKKTEIKLDSKYTIQSIVGSDGGTYGFSGSGGNYLLTGNVALASTEYTAGTVQGVTLTITYTDGSSTYTEKAYPVVMDNPVEAHTVTHASAKNLVSNKFRDVSLVTKLMNSTGSNGNGNYVYVARPNNTLNGKAFSTNVEYLFINIAGRNAGTGQGSNASNTSYSTTATTSGAKGSYYFDLSDSKTLTYDNGGGYSIPMLATQTGNRWSEINNYRLLTASSSNSNLLFEYSSLGAVNSGATNDTLSALWNYPSGSDETRMTMSPANTYINGSYSSGTQSGDITLKIQHATEPTVTNTLTVEVNVFNKGSVRSNAAQYPAKGLVASNYTASSWAAFEAAYVNANYYLNNYKNVDDSANTQNTLNNTLNTAYTSLECVHRNSSEVRVDATCIADGYSGIKCDFCGIFLEYEDIEATGHDWDDGVVTTDPTCVDTGVKTFTCKNDPAHTYTADVAVDPTAHDFEWVTATGATCGVAGSETETCKECGATGATRAIPATEAHDFEWVTVIDATCGVAGSEIETCKECGATGATRAIPATEAHDFEWITVIDATCGVAGSEIETCKECGATGATRAIPATEAHDFEWITVIDATCGVAGSEIETCKECGATGATRAIPATEAHDFEWVTVIDATCVDGSEIETCKECGATGATRAIPATEAHDFEWVTVIDATCGAAGSETETCKECGAAGATRAIPATEAHDFEWVTATGATCGVAGSETETCKECGATGATRAIPATEAHDFEWVTVTAATCGTAGSEIETCKECGATGATRAIPATEAHDFEWVTVIAATLGADGSEIEICKDCGATGTTRAIPALASYKLTVVTENCTVNAEETYVPQNAVTLVTVTATPENGYEFAYWLVNGRIVSYDATYTAQVGFSYTLTAVCVQVSEEVQTHTVTFIAFGKILKVETVADGEYATPPANPLYAGYTFTGWETSYDIVTSNLTVYAGFERDAAVTFTVTAGTGVMITGAATEDGFYNYNTKVTAKFDVATLADGEIFLGWTLDGTNIICYDTQYTFYVGTNVTVSAVIGTAEVEAQAISAVTNVTVEGTKVTILTERNAPEGYTLVAAGIIATKDSTKELTVESAEANSNVIMSTVTSTDASGQYRATFNLSTGGTLYFTSFAIYTTADGTIVTVYGAEYSRAVIV